MDLHLLWPATPIFHVSGSYLLYLSSSVRRRSKPSFTFFLICNNATCEDPISSISPSLCNDILNLLFAFFLIYSNWHSLIISLLHSFPLSLKRSTRRPSNGRDGRRTPIRDPSRNPITWGTPAFSWSRRPRSCTRPRDIARRDGVAHLFRGAPPPPYPPPPRPLLCLYSWSWIVSFLDGWFFFFLDMEIPTTAAFFLDFFSLFFFLDGWKNLWWLFLLSLICHYPLLPSSSSSSSYSCWISHFTPSCWMWWVLGSWI